MMLKSASTFLTIVLASSFRVKGEENFVFGDPTYFGSGCNKDTLRIVSGTDGYSWSVLFSDFIAETNGDDIFDRKSCNLAVKLDIAEGKKIGVFKTQYRGYTYGPSTKDSSYSTFNAEWFFAGDRGETKDKEWNSDRDEFLIENHTKEDDVEYCDCGESAVFRINTAIAAYKEKSSDPEVEVGMDTTDQTSMSHSSGGGGSLGINSSGGNDDSGYTFHIVTKDC